MTAATAPASRVLVVGASSGVGRAVSIALGHAGSRVIAMARRDDRLAELCAGGYGDIVAESGDVRQEASCRKAVDAALNAFGGLDAVVYCAGVSNMAVVCDTSIEEWQRILETNVIGVGRIFAHACSQLTANRGQMVVLSSISEQRPKPGLVPYGASKAALRKLIEGLRTEHPQVAFTIVTIGPTAGTEFGIDFDSHTAERLMTQWRAGGFLAPGQMAVEDVADRIVDCLLSPMRTEDLVLLPRPNEV
jgi:NAD(P)-dependent dehydrogenase (short-subunit alcohol dehydrogenase family)